MEQTNHKVFVFRNIRISRERVVLLAQDYFVYLTLSSLLALWSSSPRTQPPLLMYFQQVVGSGC